MSLPVHVEVVWFYYTNQSIQSSMVILIDLANIEL